MVDIRTTDEAVRVTRPSVERKGLRKLRPPVTASCGG